MPCPVQIYRSGSTRGAAQTRDGVRSAHQVQGQEGRRPDLLAVIGIHEPQQRIGYRLRGPRPQFTAAAARTELRPSPERRPASPQRPRRRPAGPAPPPPSFATLASSSRAPASRAASLASGEPRHPMATAALASLRGSTLNQVTALLPDGHVVPLVPQGLRVAVGRKSPGDPQPGQQVGNGPGGLQTGQRPGTPLSTPRCRRPAPPSGVPRPKGRQSVPAQRRRPWPGAHSSCPAGLPCLASWPRPAPGTALGWPMRPRACAAF